MVAKFRLKTRKRGNFWQQVIDCSFFLVRQLIFEKNIMTDFKSLFMFVSKV